MKKYKTAAVIMIIHGGFMEIGGIFAMIPALLMGTDKYDIGQYFSFKFQYFQDNLHMMMVMGAMYGVLRLRCFYCPPELWTESLQAVHWY